jgi:hypothetical protein
MTKTHMTRKLWVPFAEMGTLQMEKASLAGGACPVNVQERMTRQDIRSF